MAASLITPKARSPNDTHSLLPKGQESGHGRLRLLLRVSHTRPSRRRPRCGHFKARSRTEQLLGSVEGWGRPPTMPFRAHPRPGAAGQLGSSLLWDGGDISYPHALLHNGTACFPQGEVSKQDSKRWRARWKSLVALVQPEAGSVITSLLHCSCSFEFSH